MKTKMTGIIICIGVFIFLFLLMLPLALKAQSQQPEIKRYIEYIPPINYVNSDHQIGPDAFYGKGYPDDPEKYRLEVAPLTRERFIRRIKMLFGVDITNHYDDKGHCYMTPTIAVFPESQLVKIRQVNEIPIQGGTPRVVQISTLIKEHKEEWDEDVTDLLFTSYRPLSFTDIVQYCKWAYYNDNNAYRMLIQGDDTSKIMDAYSGEQTEVQHIIARHHYAAPFDCRDSLPRDVKLGESTKTVIVALREDANYIRDLNTIGRYRAINNIAETEFYKLDFDIVSMLLEHHYGDPKSPPIIIYCPNNTDVHYVAKPPVDSLRYGCYTMAILPSLNCYMTIPHYACTMGESVKAFLKDRKAEFEKYNYFGHTFLRNLAKGRDIDNNKIGVPYTAKAIRPAPMRIDPYDTGIEFDTLQYHEIFTVYEMGYDNYYLAQCAKPIEEWNKRDNKGFAVCTGRMERVWAYVPKKDVQILPTDDTTIRPFIDWGVISDADGYVNLRARNNTSEIIDKIQAGEWVKVLSYDMDYYLIETNDRNKQGRIHKSRVIW